MQKINYRKTSKLTSVLTNSVQIIKSLCTWELSLVVTCFSYKWHIARTLVWFGFHECWHALLIKIIVVFDLDQKKNKSYKLRTILIACRVIFGAQTLIALIIKSLDYFRLLFLFFFVLVQYEVISAINSIDTA